MAVRSRRSSLLFYHHLGISCSYLNGNIETVRPTVYQGSVRKHAEFNGLSLESDFVSRSTRFTTSVTTAPPLAEGMTSISTVIAAVAQAGSTLTLAMATPRRG